ncbi:YchJ family protein [Novilysobacter antarcticus]|uniref:YchJ family protein n=1 Tax=Novilysobacter antarcticus TaxID=2862543 RepID=UPI001C99AEAA|nr:YchJ family metal-binding protein [Lysobacter antarcticus]
MPHACPCNPSAAYAACCQPLHEGRTPAGSAEALMRSRYSAYVLGLRDYLLATWHPDTCPAALDMDDSPDTRWLGLDVKRHVDAGDGTALVEFVARYKVGGAPAVRMHEISRFECRDGIWLYVDGEFPGKAR